MRKLVLSPPVLREYLGAQADDFPTGFMWPWSVLVREAWVHHGPALKKEPIEFTFPGYGVLTMQGRSYTLVPTNEYAREKGYDDKLEGTWGE